MTRHGFFACTLCLVAACSSPSSEGPTGEADSGSVTPDADLSSDSSEVSEADAPADTGLSADSEDTETAATSDSGPTSSHGNGGLTCTSKGDVSVDGNSYSYCVATVAGVELKIVEPDAGAAAPLRLALYFHGDGAGPYSSGLAIKKHAPWTSSHRVLYVAARAPNACAWWLKPGYTTCDGTTTVPDDAIDRTGENAVAVNAVIQALRAGWDLADSPILYGGSSGGSIFLSASFLPLYGDKHPGAYALSCGGQEPWAGELAWDATNPAQLGATRLFFTYGDKDFVAPDVQQALSFYQALGFPAEAKVIAESVGAGTSHCGNVGGSYSYDQLGRVPEVWASYLGE